MTARKPPVGKPKTEVEEVRDERDAEALRLRAAGFSYEEIAKRVGFANRGGAWKAVERAQGDGPGGDPKDLSLERTRLDMLQRSLMQKALSGDVPAVMAVLKISEHRARLSGMYGRAVEAETPAATEPVKGTPLDELARRRSERKPSPARRKPAAGGE